MVFLYFQDKMKISKCFLASSSSFWLLKMVQTLWLRFRIMMIVCHSAIQNIISRHTLLLSEKHRTTGLARSGCFLPIPHTQRVEGLHAVHSLVGPQHFICNGAQGRVGTLDLELHDQGTFPSTIFNTSSNFGIFSHRIAMKLLQFLSIITDLAFAAADSF